MAPETIGVADVWLVVLRDRDYDDIDEEDPFNPSRRITPYNPSRAQVHSFCSYSSSMGSQTSLNPPLQATSSTPEYMWVCVCVWERERESCCFLSCWPTYLSSSPAGTSPCYLKEILAMKTSHWLGAVHHHHRYFDFNLIYWQFYSIFVYLMVSISPIIGLLMCCKHCVAKIKITVYPTLMPFHNRALLIFFINHYI